MGTAAAKMRAPAMGLAGFIAAPLGFSIARFLQRVIGQALRVAVAAAAPSLFVVVLLKAIEYASLGTIIGWAAGTAEEVRVPTMLRGSRWESFSVGPPWA